MAVAFFVVSDCDLRLRPCSCSLCAVAVAVAVPPFQECRTLKATVCWACSGHREEVVVGKAWRACTGSEELRELGVALGGMLMSYEGQLCGDWMMTAIAGGGGGGGGVLLSTVVC